VTSSIPLLELEGTPYDRGRRHGEKLADHIRELSALETQDLIKATGMSDAEFLGLADRYLPYAASYAPDLVDEMKGIADGAALPLERIFLLNAFLDLYDMFVPENRLRLARGCTTFGVNSAGTDEGVTLIGQTYDLARHFQGHGVVLHITSPDGGRQLVYTFAGILGCAGVNSVGLGLVINKLHPMDGHPGVPYPMVVRRVLSQPRLTHAVGFIVSAHRASGINYLIGDKSELIDVETTATKFDVLYACDNYYVHTNHYVSPTLKQYDASVLTMERRPARAHSRVRYGRATSLLGGLVRKGQVSLQQLVEITKDHGDHPMGICHHSYELSPECSGKTIATMVMRPSSGEMYIANGNACETEFVKLKA